MERLHLRDRKSFVIRLCSGLFIQTDGTTGEVFTELILPDLLPLGPHIESVSPLTATRNRTSTGAWEWGVYMATNLMGRTYPTPTRVSGAVTANGELIHPCTPL